MTQLLLAFLIAWGPAGAAAAPRPAPRLSPRADAKAEAKPAPSPTAAAPRVFALDPQALMQVKAAIAKGEKGYKPALARLVQDADAALKRGPYSVTDKKATPPSGDKHDYLSLARYYWPDPSKPDGLPYIARDGEVNPEIFTIPDHTHFDALMEDVSILGLAYYYTGKERYAEHATRLLRVWFREPATRMNPNLNYTQGIRGLNDGRNSGLIETRELAVLLDGVGLIGRSKAWTAADQEILVDWMSRFLDWLLTSPLGKQEMKAVNNHGTFIDAQTAAIALFVGKDDLARGFIEATRKRIATQIAPDGQQPIEMTRTITWHYHVFNLQGLFRLASLGERLGLDLWRFETPDGRSLRKAVDFILPYGTGQDWPYKQISPREFDVFHALLRQAAFKYQRKEYREAGRKVPNVDDATARVNLTLPVLDESR